MRSNLGGLHWTWLACGLWGHKPFQVTPTYTTPEILALIPNLDMDEMEILSELVIEEKDEYTIVEHSIIYDSFQKQVQRLVKESTGRVLEQIWKWKWLKPTPSKQAEQR